MGFNPSVLLDLTQTVDKSINQNTAFDSEFESDLDPFNLFTVTVTLVRESLLKPHPMECDFFIVQTLFTML